MSARLNTSTRRNIRAIAAGSAAAALVAVSGSTPMAAAATGAADDKVDVVNTETVQVYMDAEGEIESRRIYEQLVLTGTGSVDIKNPISEDGLRNLDGFSGFELKDGEQVSTFDVDGVERARTVSDYEGKLPLKIDVKYTLDGKVVKPGDVVGADGRLKVDFTVENVTGEAREVTIADGKGGTVERTVEVPVPIVGSLSTVAPDSFTEVSSDQANMAGDGKGGTKLSFTMTLFPPIGSAKSTFGYTANIEDGVVPRIDVTALPVNPLESPSFKTAATSYQGGADTGTQLAAGATEIDANLLKLRDGAGDLLAGLLKLHAGSKELQAGLTGKAAPGAEQLADGTAKLDDGLGKAEDGASLIADGTGTALAGSRKLSDGLGQISGGLALLADTKGLPKAAQGVDLLKAGVDQILAGFGDVGQTGTLIDGLARLQGGATQLQGGAGQIKGGLAQLRGDGSPATPGLVGAKGGVDQVKSGLEASLSGGGSMDQLVGGLNALMTLDCGPICKSVITNQILPGVETSRNNLQAAVAGLGQVSTGLASAIGALNTQLIPGVGQLETGAGELAAGAGTAKAGALKLKAGNQAVADGLDDLDAGLTSAVAGVLQLNAGSAFAYDKSGDLVDGLNRIDDGASTLASKLGEAHDGSTKIASGADELADGLTDAADGSGKLADGLGEAAEGAPKLVDGAGRLSTEGAQVIAGKGAETAVNYGELYAVLEAGAERADTERMAFGAPEGATGLTAYNFIIKGEDGEGGRNWARALGGLGLLAAGGAVFAYRRRLI